MQLGVLATDPIYPRTQGYDPSCRRLALGILLQALRDILAPRESSWKKGEDWTSDALEWFDSEDDSPGSFHWVCFHLRLDTSDFRRWLNRYQAGGPEEQKRLARKLNRFHIPRSG